MRVSDLDHREGDHRGAAGHELVDIHRRLDRLTEQMQSLELQIARGGRFPPAAWGAFIALFLAVVGSGGTLYSELQMSRTNAGKALTLIEQHALNAPVLRETVGRMRHELDEINRRTAEGTDDRWRKRDDETRMAELHRYLDTQLGSLRERIDRQERRSEERDVWWRKVWESGALRGMKP